MTDEEIEKALIYDMPAIIHEIYQAEVKKQNLPTYPNAVIEAKKILKERLAKAPKIILCPNCGRLLDENGCCKHCNICGRR